MRVRIIFQVLNGGGLLPFHQQVLLSNFVNDFIPDEYAGTFDWNFSGIKGQTSVTSKGLFYNSQRVTLVFSSRNSDLVASFVSGIFSCDTIGLAGLDIRPLEVLEEVSEIQESELKYVCISPIVLVADGMPEEELRQFIPPTSPIFADLLYESTMRRMVNLGINVDFFSARENFSFRPDLEYLRKSKDNDRKFSRVYTFDDRANVLDLRGYTFPFYLKADSEVHEFLFNSGFGEATENGFGMVDFADRKNRTQLLEFRQIPGNIQEGA